MGVVTTTVTLAFSTIIAITNTVTDDNDNDAHEHSERKWAGCPRMSLNILFKTQSDSGEGKNLNDGQEGLALYYYRLTLTGRWGGASAPVG